MYVFSVALSSFAMLPAITAAAKRPMFSKPFCWAPSARTMRALVAGGGPCQWQTEHWGEVFDFSVCLEARGRCGGEVEQTFVQ